MNFNLKMAIFSLILILINAYVPENKKEDMIDNQYSLNSEKFNQLAIYSEHQSYYGYITKIRISRRDKIVFINNK